MNASGCSGEAGALAVELGQLEKHAAELDRLAQRVGEAASAARVGMDPDAYGIVCSPLASATTDTATALSEAVRNLQGGVYRHAGDIGACQYEYENVEKRIAAGFEGGVGP